MHGAVKQYLLRQKHYRQQKILTEIFSNCRTEFRIFDFRKQKFGFFELISVSVILDVVSFELISVSVIFWVDV